MQYKVAVLDRLVLLKMLPDIQNRGTDVIDMRIIQDLKHAVGFTEQEHKDLQFKIETDPNTHAQVTSWVNIDPISIEIGDRAAEIIRKGLQFLSDHVPPKLTEDHTWLVNNFLILNDVIENDNNRSQSDDGKTDNEAKNE